MPKRGTTENRMLNLGKSEVIDDFKKKENEPHVD